MKNPFVRYILATLILIVSLSAFVGAVLFCSWAAQHHTKITLISVGSIVALLMGWMAVMAIADWLESKFKK